MGRKACKGLTHIVTYDNLPADVKKNLIYFPICGTDGYLDIRSGHWYKVGSKGLLLCGYTHLAGSNMYLKTQGIVPKVISFVTFTNCINLSH